MTLVKGLVEDLFEDIADVTLINEYTKPMLTDDANKEIPSNVTMHVAPPGGQISYYGVNPWVRCASGNVWKFSHQVAPLTLIRNLATRWRHMHSHIAWDFFIGMMPHHQLVLVLYLHQSESHQQCLQTGLQLGL